MWIAEDSKKGLEKRSDNPAAQLSQFNPEHELIWKCGTSV